MARVSTGLILFLWIISTAHSQAQAACPTSELLALARTASTCARLVFDQACYGNGTARVLSSASAAFTQPGDLVPLAGLSRLEIIAEGDISTAILALKAPQGVADPQNTIFWLLGDVSLENLVPYPTLLTLETTANAKLRAVPDDEGELLEEVTVTTSLEANAISSDGRWLRVSLPNSIQTAWVSRDVITTRDSLAGLAVSDISEPLAAAFSRVTLGIGAGVACAGRLPSGVFIQSPSAVPFAIEINGLRLNVQGTLFIAADAADETLRVYNLFGATMRVLLDNALMPIPSGTVYRAGADQTIPYSADEIATLPTTSLPYRVTAALPVQPDQLAALLQPQAIATAAPVVLMTALPDTRCRYTMTLDTTVRLGPGTLYEASGDIEMGTEVDPMRRTLATDGEEWVQLRDSRWLPSRRVQADGICTELALFVDVPPPPTNRFIMETCQSTNGPLRRGQQVTLEFLPPAFESLAAAQLAPQVDRGRFKIGTRTTYATASQPIVFNSVGTAKYAIRFSMVWRADPGTYRIESDRLDYELICQVVVPSGN